MKKPILKGVLIMSLALLLSSCFGRYSIKVVSGEQHLYKCPKSAKPGETVTVLTAMVTDADLYLNGNVEIKKINDGEFEFVMPDHDVELKITVISNGLA
jgi:hypothetical protein